MKLVKKIALILLIVIVVFFLTKNVVIKAVVETGVRLVTGLTLSMEKLDVGIISTKLHIQNLKILNPQSFEEKIMLDMPEILIDYALMDIITGTIHLETMIIHLKEFNVVKNKDGMVNLESLKMAKKEEEEKPTPEPEPTKPKKKGKAPEFLIDNFILRLGSISFMDYTGKQPKVNSFAFNLDEQYKDITRPQLIIGIIVQKALMKASMAKITGFKLNDIEGMLSGTLSGVQGLAVGTVGTAGKMAGKTIDSVKDLPGTVSNVAEVGEKTLGTTTEAAKETVSMLKDKAKNVKDLTGKLKLPFGKDE